MAKYLPISTEFLFCENRNRPEGTEPDPALRAPKTEAKPLRNAFFTAFCEKRTERAAEDRQTAGKGDRRMAPSDQGSLSIEAACTVPLFLMLVFALLSFFSGIRTELLLGSALSDTARELSRTCDPAFSAKAPAMVLEDFLENQGGAADFYREDEAPHISCAKLGPSGEEYRITASYRISIPFFSGISERFSPGISVSQRSFSGKNFAEGIGSRLVYVTRYGSVYHSFIDCRVLRTSVTAVDFSALSALRNKDGKIYYPCGICGSGPRGTDVFVTGYGTSWHSDRSCAGLRRGIRRIPLSEVGERPLCSYCRERGGE